MANGAGQAAVSKPAGTGDDWQDFKPDEQGWQDYSPEAKPKPGPLMRFKHGLRSAMGFPEEGGLKSDIEQIGSGFKQMATHPIDSATDLAKGVFGGQEDVAGKGIERMSRPGAMNKVEGAAQWLESGVPFVGPLMSSAGESAESGDYAGMAGKMLPLAAGSEDVVRGTRGGLAEAVRSAPEVGGAVGGYAAGATVGHPWLGGYAGREMGRRLQLPADRVADFIRGPGEGARASSSNIGGEWVPEGEMTGKDATEILKGSPTPFGSKQLLSIPDATSSGKVTGSAKLPKPRMSAAETGKYLESKGRGTGTLREGVEGADGSTKAPEPSEFMKRKIGEAEGRYDARRMAATGAERGEDSRVGDSGSQTAGEARPVPKKAPDFRTGTPETIDEATATPHETTRSRQTGASPAKLREEMRQAEGGESRMEQLRRGATGESPMTKSIKRKFARRRATGDDD